MKIVKAPTYKCNKCKKTFETSVDEFSDPELYSEGRNMGNELQFVWSFEFECENCQNPIEITIEGYEYPVGFFNYAETHSEGCLIVQSASLEVDFQEP